jgi:hypothetical protein
MDEDEIGDVDGFRVEHRRSDGSSRDLGGSTSWSYALVAARTWALRLSLAEQTGTVVVVDAVTGTVVAVVAVGTDAP